MGKLLKLLPTLLMLVIVVVSLTAVIDYQESSSYDREVNIEQYMERIHQSEN